MAALTPDNLERARAIVALYPKARSALIPLCHLAQSQDGWLTPEAMEDIAALVGVTPAEVRGTASFYDIPHRARRPSRDRGVHEHRLHAGRCL